MWTVDLTNRKTSNTVTETVTRSSMCP
jgi:hypothetical protein